MSIVTKSLQVLGTYRMANLLGFNGMFATFQVVETNSQAPGALVVVHKSNIVDPAAWAATQRDTAAIAGAIINRVCPVGGCGEEAAHYFSIYSWLGGQHLGLQVRDSGLPEPAQSFEIIAQVAEGLGGLHRKGVVHRIVSPASIFIDQTGNVQLLHAGWGRLVLGSRDGLVNPAWGCIAPFVSPELAAGRDVDEAGDVYALGANLYFLLTGEPPHWDDDPARLLETIAAGKLDLSRLPGSLPPQAREVLEEMLSTNPDDRPVNLPALSDRLQSIARKLNALNQTEPPRTEPSSQEAAAAGAAASSGAVRRPNLPQPVAAPEAPSRRQSLPSMAEIAAITPDDAKPSPKKANRQVLIMAGAGTVLLAGAGIFAAYILFGMMGSKEESAPAPNSQPKVTVTTPAANDAKSVSEYDAASEKLRGLALLAIGFNRTNGEWPTNAEALVPLGATEADLTDPWGSLIDVRGSFVVSAGKNKKWDDADDIWWDAEKNLRGGFHPLNAKP
ncbi:protein kinase [bacterium]|nr:protein kinase [bacterium]